MGNKLIFDSDSIKRWHARRTENETAVQHKPRCILAGGGELKLWLLTQHICMEQVNFFCYRNTWDCKTRLMQDSVRKYEVSKTLFLRHYRCEMGQKSACTFHTKFLKGFLMFDGAAWWPEECNQVESIVASFFGFFEIYSLL